MFEKEAYNYSIDTYETCLYDNLPYVNDSRAREEAFREGAEFGYNKSNEWHKIADGAIPKENKLYLVQIKDNGLAIAYFNGQHWETRYNLGESGHCVETVIAWREIPTFEE